MTRDRTETVDKAAQALVRSLTGAPQEAADEGWAAMDPVTKQKWRQAALEALMAASELDCRCPDLLRADAERQGLPGMTDYDARTEAAEFLEAQRR